MRFFLLVFFTCWWIFPVHAQTILNPNTWEEVRTIPPIHDAFIRRKGIQEIRFHVQSKKPDEVVRHEKDVTLSFDWDGNLVQKKITSNYGDVIQNYIYEDGVLKIETEIKHQQETRIVYVYNNYGMVVEKQFFRRYVGEPVKRTPFKTEKFIRKQSNAGRTRQVTITDKFGVQISTEKRYLDAYGQTEELVKRLRGKNQTVRWSRNPNRRLERLTTASNYLRCSYEFFYKNGKLDRIEEENGSEKNTIFYQYEATVGGALSSILRTNIRTKEMEIVHVEYSFF